MSMKINIEIDDGKFLDALAAEISKSKGTGSNTETIQTAGQAQNEGEDFKLVRPAGGMTISCVAVSCNG